MSGAVVTQLAGLESKYRPYPEYKDSGVEWLDCLPMDWGKTTLKMLIDVRDGTHDTPSYVEVSEDSFPIVTSKDVTGGKIDLTNCKHISKEDYEAIIKRSAVSEGDILMPMIGTVGFPILVTGHSNFAIKNLALFKTSERSDLISTVFLLYFLNSNECSLQFSLESRGGVQNFVSLGTLRNLGLPLVPFKEQQKIVDFLDHETARIDRLIAQQQRLIELLKEKRQAVISHAVTKGLNPNAPMKDSGVEWLGQVPEHWTVSRVKYVSSVSGGFAFSSDDFVDSGIQLIKIGNLYQSRLQLERDPTFLPIGFSKSHAVFKVSKGDLLMSLTGTLGKRDYGFAVRYDADEDSLLNQRVAKFNLNQSKINPDFMLLLLLSDSYLSQIYSMPSGTKQANLSNSDVLSPLICYPSQLNEQESIVKHVYDSVSKIDLLTSKAIQAIDFMNERRYSLISAAVTGKIDLRNWERPNA